MGGNRDKLEKEKAIGKRIPFSFCVSLPLPLPRLFAPASQATEFTQYSFTVHNKVVVAENLGSVL